jgi:dGTPase
MRVDKKAEGGEIKLRAWSMALARARCAARPIEMVREVIDQRARADTGRYEKHSRPARDRGVALIPWACDPYASDPPSPGGRHCRGARTHRAIEHQRDRDRIVHSTAFRRLVYKTQVFLNHEGDLFRTRLTHSLEVAQLGRSIARSLRAERGPGRSHRAGARPGPHALRPCRAGRAATTACGPHGGFEHNLQSLRVVDRLEQRYPAFDGLNLSFETREGILKHCSPVNARKLRRPNPAAWRIVSDHSPAQPGSATVQPGR